MPVEFLKLGMVVGFVVGGMCCGAECWGIGLPLLAGGLICSVRLESELRP